jgi:hypothetical protein
VKPFKEDLLLERLANVLKAGVEKTI